MSVKVSAKVLVSLLIFGLRVASARGMDRPRELHFTIPRHSELTPVQKLNREGVDAVLGKHYEKAEGLFFKAYLYDPIDPFTLNNIGYVSELQGQVERAEKFYKLAEEQGCDAVIERSTAKTLKGKPMMDALGGIANAPMRVNRINVLGMGLLNQGHPFEAITAFQQALALDVRNPFTLNNLGVASEATGDLEAAITYYEQAASTRSQLPVVVTARRSWRGKAVSELAAASAHDVTVRIAAMTPEQVHAEMLTVRGVAELNANDWNSARKDFVQAFQLDPSNAFSLNNAGYVAERDGELEIARSYYARAQSARDSRSLVGLATDLSAQGHPLGELADQSHSGVDTALDAYGRSRLGKEGVIQLRSRRLPEAPVPASPAPNSTLPLPLPLQNGEAPATTDPASQSHP